MARKKVREDMYPQDDDYYYQEEYDQGYPQDEEQYMDDGIDPSPPEKAPPELVSTSQAINLTCTLGAASGLFAWFLYFADQRSNAVRRISVQSMGLTAAYVVVAVIIWVISIILGSIPFLGFVLQLIFNLVLIALTIVVIALKVQMMMHAYKGYAYLLPIVGPTLRRFE